MQQATSFGTVSWGQKPSPPSAASPTLASSPSGLQREDSGSGKKPRRRGSRRKSNAAAAAGELVPSATELINQESDAIFLMEDGSGFEDLGVEENGSGVVVTDKDLPEDFAFMSKQEQIAVRRKIIKKKQALAEKRAAKLRRLEELLEQRRREAEQRLLICQSNVDYEINQVVKSRLNCALMLQGVLGLVALALCAVALLSSPSVVITVTGGVASATAARSNATEFLGYNTWEAFVDSCCCTSAVNTNSTATAYVAVEKWICANGKVKERVRAYRPNLVTSGGSDRTVEDGYAARTLCNVSFATGCGLQVVTSTSGATPATSSLRVACRAGITVTASMESFW